jgi:GNAT superfamily N-acetyltransferase
MRPDSRDSGGRHRGRLAVRSALVSDFEIRPSRFGAPTAQALIAAAQAELTERYGSEDENPIESIQFDPPEGAFLVAWREGAPAACAGWRTISHFREDSDLPEDVAEVKRMYVTPSARGSGIASVLLAALEESAREHGMHRMILETGQRQPEALRFYVKSGYAQIPNYGYYKDEPDCVSFGRDL